MASKITTFYEDSAKENALYPRTKVSAVSDNDGNGLEALLNAKQNQLVSGTNIKTINGNSLLGAGDVEIGGYPDASNLIASSASSYTATEDCYVFCIVTTSNDTVKPTLDGVEIGHFYSQQTVYHTFSFPLKAGSTVSGVGTIKAYGLM